MNILRLCRYLYTKKWVAEIVLLFQLVCMLELSFIVLNPLNDFYRNKQEIENCYSVNADKLIHVNSTVSLVEQSSKDNVDTSELLYNIIKNTKGVGEILRFGIDGTLLEIDDEKINAKVFFYSREMFENTNIELSAGQIKSNESDVIPVLISDSMKYDLEIGSIIDIETTASLSLKCKVVGIISSESALPAIKNYGSFPELESLAVISKEVSKEKYIVVYDASEDIITREMNNNFVVIPEKGENITALVKRLQENISNYGTVQEYKEISTQALKNTIIENGFCVLCFFLLNLIALFGYGGYLYLMIRQKQKELSIFNILGMTRFKMMLIVFISNIMLLSIAFLISINIYPWFAVNIMKVGVLKPGAFIYIGCCIYLLAIMLFSIIVACKKTQSGAVINRFKEGD